MLLQRQGIAGPHRYQDAQVLIVYAPFKVGGLLVLLKCGRIVASCHLQVGEVEQCIRLSLRVADGFA